MASVLYIDDDRFDSQIMIERLSHFGHAIDFEHDAAGADDRLRSDTSYDVIVLDIMMRRMMLDKREGESQTGHILYRVAREKRPNIPIVVLSALGKKRATVDMEDDVNMSWLRKPVDAVRLHDEIRRMVSGDREP